MTKAEEAALEVYPKDILPTEASFTLRFRYEAAKDILCALIARSSVFGGKYKEDGIRTAIEYTDELIRQLKETEKYRPQT